MTQEELDALMNGDMDLDEEIEPAVTMESIEEITDDEEDDDSN